MLDNLRDQAAQSEYFQEEEVPAFDEPAAVRRPAARRSLDQMTGMNAQQRFLLAFMMLILVCLLGTMFLLITGKVVPPFF